MTFNNTLESFSSYTKGIHKISEIFHFEEFSELTISIPASLKSKIEKRFNKYACSTLSIDGVYANISFKKALKIENEYFEIVAKVTHDFFSGSSLVNLKQGDKVNIGMISRNSKKWLQDSFPIEKVKLNHIEVAKGHTYTKEFKFECTQKTFGYIQKLQYIGLNGSGLFIQHFQNLEGRYYFSIHAG